MFSSHEPIPPPKNTKKQVCSNHGYVGIDEENAKDAVKHNDLGKAETQAEYVVRAEAARDGKRRWWTSFPPDSAVEASKRAKLEANLAYREEIDDELEARVAAEEALPAPPEE